MKNKIIFNQKTKIRATKEQRYSKLDEEIVILALKNEQYYSLNGVGATIWSYIQEPRTVKEISDRLIKTYQVEPTQLEQDMMIFLEELAKEKLIEITA
ncbi:MAG: PqqD family protein [Gomphosphaeria aponina SAG 52.96 = DSM 107014]|uniref:PqqD family protein n=1 Tax=Gomphosphaeria aponina SAG 52.96 = DSM 107014 TaxID=1521640 RepID=A0A941GXV1_9CHRO|nr:PqqD family protein [Gomphosphaeria aponina SAG 52.96 = DSM 107014]